MVDQPNAAADRVHPGTAGSPPESAPERSNGLPAGLPSRNWGWFMARGVLLVILGLLAGFAPGWALFSFALLFAAFSFADGVLSIASGVRGATHGKERWWALILSGIAGIAVGVLFVLFPLLSTVAYALVAVMVIAVWAIVTGALEIAAAIRLRKEIGGEWLYALSGLASLLLGIGLIALAMLSPSISVLSVGWLIALYALIAGVALIALALRLRRRGTAPPEEPAPGAAQP